MNTKHAPQRAELLRRTVRPRAAGLGIAAVTIGAFACNITEVGSDAGPSDAAPQMVGDQCSAIAGAFCNRAIGGCSVPDTLADCISNETVACCTGSACTSISKLSASALDGCTSDLAAEDCNSVVNVSPFDVASCQGVRSQ